MFRVYLILMMPISVGLFLPIFTQAEESMPVGMEETPARIQRDLNSPYTLGIYGIADTSFLTTFDSANAPPRDFELSVEQQLGVAFALHIYDDASPWARGILGAGFCLLVERCTLWFQTKAFISLGAQIQTMFSPGPEVEAAANVSFTFRGGGAFSLALTYGGEGFSFGPYLEGFVYDFQSQTLSISDITYDANLMDRGINGAVEVGLMAIFDDILYLRAGYRRGYERYPDSDGVVMEHSSNGLRLGIGLLLGTTVAGQRY